MWLSAEERILGLSRIWSDAAQNFPYWYKLPDLDWDSTYKSYLGKVMEEADPLRYYALLMKFTNLLGNGHTYVVMPEELKPTYAVPFGTTYIQGKHILSEVPERFAGQLYAEIVSINGVPTEDYLEKYISPYVYCRNRKGRFYHGCLGYAIGCCESGSIDIATNKGGLSVESGCFEETVGHSGRFTVEEANEWKLVFCSDDLLTLYITADNIAVIRIASFADPSLPALLYRHVRAFQDCRGFVVDVTQNSGGSGHNAAAVAQLFFQGEFSDGIYKTRQHISEQQAYGRYRELEKLDRSNALENSIYETSKRMHFIDTSCPVIRRDCPVFFSQPVVVLADSLTASAAESFLSSMKYRDRAVILGEASYGSNGQPLLGDLPGGGYYGINTQVCQLPDGTEYEYTGIQPDYPIEVTLADYMNGYDRILAEGLQTIRGMC